MTNIEGSAHLDVGLVDTITDLMTQLFGIESQCLFRADLDRRLDGNWDLKFEYPEVLSGLDNLRALIESFAPSRVDTLKALLNAFTTFQYRQDYRVKFKQIGLENRLLDLFTDTPFKVTCSQAAGELNPTPRDWASLLRVEADQGRIEIYSTPTEGEGSLGVSTFLLSKFARRHFPRLVVEGAPGQGKSTLAQYLCQIHRMRWLNAVDDLLLVPEDHRRSVLRLPIKVDLRDLAVWLGGSDPFVAERQKVANTDLSLETFLVRLIRHSSGGHPCTVADLVSVAERAPILLVLDGLDEVADPRARELVVQHVNEGVARLEGFCPDLQTIVTSRPTIFANSPGFDPTDFPHLTLTSLTRYQILDYGQRWMNARQILEGDRAQFMEVLDQRLQQPHLRDLARNPMQLAILLELIRTKGAALPDKRTSLYDQYVGLFFDREAEKSVIVRDAREELLQVHGYLAWKLHSSSEEGLTEGRMEVGNIKNEVRKYLEQERHNAAAVEELFTALVERVVMLVSRVQGTFEFEVQPLREYFAGRFLCDAAPPSRAGFERSDTKIDRFDAIARNPYWLNVTRFFAGMFGKGELMDLADRVSSLSADDALKNLRLPAKLSAQLLSDWVFFQTPRAVEEVAAYLGSEAGLIRLCAGRGYDREEIPFLSDKCGRAIVCGGAFALIAKLLKAKGGAALDWVHALTVLVHRNATPEERYAWWQSEALKVCSDDSQWHSIGCEIGAQADLSVTELMPLIERSENFDSIVADYFFHGRDDVAFSNARSENAIESAFVDHGHIWPENGPLWIHSLGEVLRMLSYADELSEVVEHLAGVFVDEVREEKLDVSGTTGGPEWRSKCLIDAIRMEIGDYDGSPGAQVRCLKKVFEALDELWGGRRVIYALACRWAMILSQTEIEQAAFSESSAPLLDSDTPLLAGFVDACRHADDIGYWQAIAAEYEAGRSKELILLAFCNIASPEVIKDLGGRLFSVADTDPIWIWAERGVGNIDSEELTVDLTEQLDSWPISAGLFLGNRFTSLVENPKFVARMRTVDPPTWTAGYRLQNWSVTWVMKGLINWDDFLSLIARLNHQWSVGISSYSQRGEKLQKSMPLDVALKVTSAPLAWPVGLWGIAEAVLAEHYKAKVIPIARIAREQAWVSA